MRVGASQRCRLRSACARRRQRGASCALPWLWDAPAGAAASPARGAAGCWAARASRACLPTQLGVLRPPESGATSGLQRQAAQAREAAAAGPGLALWRCTTVSYSRRQRGETLGGARTAAAAPEEATQERLPPQPQWLPKAARLGAPAAKGLGQRDALARRCRRAQQAGRGRRTRVRVAAGCPGRLEPWCSCLIPRIEVTPTDSSGCAHRDSRLRLSAAMRQVCAALLRRRRSAQAPGARTNGCLECSRHGWGAHGGNGRACVSARGHAAAGALRPCGLRTTPAWEKLVSFCAALQPAVCAAGLS